MRALRCVAAVAASLILSGCLGMERNVAREIRDGTHWGAVALFDDKARVLTPAERARVAKADLNIMALSGGGADGAFGAGLITGWGEAGTRPEFDIVTGVSTGALMATFVFLGPSADDALTSLYTTTRSDEVFADRGLTGLLGDSLLDTAPLRTKIAAIVTERTLAAVAAEHARGRRLYVATTNLDAGTVSVWNLGAIASSDDPGRLELYREILRASAAVPGYFAPVLIRTSGDGGDQMHVDGGVKAPVLLRSFMLEGPYRRKNVYVLVNGALKLRTSADAVRASLGDIAKKSITELLRGLLYKTVYQSYVTVRQAGASFNLSYIPDDVPETRDPLKFVPEEMQALYAAGRALGRSGRAWHSEPPRLESLERIEAARQPRPAPAARRPAPGTGAPAAAPAG